MKATRNSSCVHRHRASSKSGLPNINLRQPSDKTLCLCRSRKLKEYGQRLSMYTCMTMACPFSDLAPPVFFQFRNLLQRMKRFSEFFIFFQSVGRVASLVDVACVLAPRAFHLLPPPAPTQSRSNLNSLSLALRAFFFCFFSTSSVCARQGGLASPLRRIGATQRPTRRRQMANCTLFCLSSHFKTPRPQPGKSAQ